MDEKLKGAERDGRDGWNGGEILLQKGSLLHH